MNTTISPIQVRKSSADCAAYNTQNAGSIEAGLVPAWEPNAEIIADEKKQKEREQRQIILNQKATEFWKLVISLLPKDDQTLFDHPAGAHLRTVNNCSFRIIAEIERYSTYGYSRMHPTGHYYRVVVGDYGDKSIYKFKDENAIATDAKTARKAADRIASELVSQRRSQQARVDQYNNEARRDEFFKANEATLRKLGINYSSRLTPLNNDPTKFSAQITFTGTAEQWKTLHELLVTNNLGQ